MTISHLTPVYSLKSERIRFRSYLRRVQTRVFRSKAVYLRSRYVWIRQCFGDKKSRMNAWRYPQASQQKWANCSETDIHDPYGGRPRHRRPGVWAPSAPWTHVRGARPVRQMAHWLPAAGGKSGTGDRQQEASRERGGERSQSSRKRSVLECCVRTGGRPTK